VKTGEPLSVSALISTAFSCKCPRCRKGGLYASSWSSTLRESCPECGLTFSHSDSADAPAFFLIFGLGLVLVPLALIVEFMFSLPLWVHGVLWTGLALVLTLWMLRPLKAAMIALQFRHRPEDWKREGDGHA